MPTLADTLVEVLERVGEANARWLFRKLPSSTRMLTSKRDVNRILYRRPDLFVAKGDTPPVWRLAGAEPEATWTSQLGPQIPPVPLGSFNLSLYPWQADAYRGWVANSYRGIVEAVTGAGKTRIGLRAAIEELQRGGRVLVITPTLELREQWVRQLEELLPPAMVGRRGGGSRDTFQRFHVLVGVVNSMRKEDPRLPSTGGLLIADECHRYGSAINKTSLHPAFQRRLGRTVTAFRFNMVRPLCRPAAMAQST